MNSLKTALKLKGSLKMGEDLRWKDYEYCSNTSWLYFCYSLASLSILHTRYKIERASSEQLYFRWQECKIIESEICIISL